MEDNIFIFILVGFLAQMIDGAVGMAYGVTSNSVLLSIGLPPAIASASVHMAEVFTTFISGISHWRLNNINKDLIIKLMTPGVIGGVLGAYILTSLPGDIIRPFIAVYLFIMGVFILFKAFRKNHETREVTTFIPPIGFIGGFLDAVGGGGWGPVVTTTLVARGNHPRYTIGSVHFTEFFVTLAQSITFILTLSMIQYWRIILGLLIGGAIAAPLAALVTKKLPVRLLMFMVGILIIVLSIRTLVLAIR
ncbi:MAG: hypothetical protein A2Y53_02050 [Chloroflexi bacterium RBG_16_47_49]|nr:MAG: hypothetical protein A2Y53_02050 [Chloroflexi bacterium RBG_16_47_49]